MKKIKLTSIFILFIILILPHTKICGMEKQSKEQNFQKIKEDMIKLLHTEIMDQIIIIKNHLLYGIESNDAELTLSALAYLNSINKDLDSHLFLLEKKSFVEDLNQFLYHMQLIQNWNHQAPILAAPKVSTPLHSMAFIGNIAFVEAALRINRNWVTTKDRAGKTPINIAEEQCKQATNDFIKARYQQVLRILNQVQPCSA